MQLHQQHAVARTRDAVIWPQLWPRLARPHGLLALAIAATAACSAPLKPCAQDSECGDNLSCIDGFCQRALFGTDGLATVADTSTTGDSASLECAAKPGGPSARAEASGAVVGGKIVVFGGDTGHTGRCSSALVSVADRWLHKRCEGWHEHKPNPGPGPRIGAATAVDQLTGDVYLYGGRSQGASGGWVPHRDLWRYDSSADAWKLLSPSGTTSSTHGALVYDRKRKRALVLGGDTSTQPGKSTPSASMYTYELKTTQWLPGKAKGAPTARSQHVAAISDQDTHIYVHGGVTAVGSVDNNLWRLDLANNKWEIIATPAERPSGRVGAVLAAVPGKRKMLLFGGADSSATGFRNDVWQLDTDKLRWDRLADGDLGTDGKYGGKLNVGKGINCNSGLEAGGLLAGFTQLDYNAPQRRAHMIGGWDVARAALVIFGGRSECGPLADVWRFDPTNAKWGPIDDASAGRSCPRRKPVADGQTSACELLCEP